MKNLLSETQPTDPYLGKHGTGPVSHSTMELHAHHTYAFYLAEGIDNILAERY